MIPLWMFPMAIVCGNTFVLKPSNRTRCRPCCWWSWRSAGVPAGVLNVVHGGKDVVDTLCTHEHVKGFRSLDRLLWARMCTASVASTASVCSR